MKEEKTHARAGRCNFSSHIREDLFYKFSEISKETGVTKTRLWDRAVELLIEAYQKDGIIIFK